MSAELVQVRLSPGGTMAEAVIEEISDAIYGGTEDRDHIVRRHFAPGVNHYGLLVDGPGSRRRWMAAAGLIYYEDDTAEVDFLVVPSGYRGEGYGSKMLSELEVLAASRGMLAMEVTSTVGARDFYRGQDYRLVRNDRFTKNLRR